MCTYISLRRARRAWPTPVSTLVLVALQAVNAFGQVPPTSASRSAAVVTQAPATLAVAVQPNAPVPEPPRIVPNRTVPTVTAPDLRIQFGPTPSTRAIASVRALPEMLHPVNDAAPAHNQVVGRALEAFAAEPDRAVALDRLEHVARDADVGPWRAALLANVATLRDQSGFYARAADLWEAAWELARYGESADAHAVADYAIGKRLIAATNFGQVAVLEHRLAELNARPVRGAPAHDVQLAREGLNSLTYHHDKATFSGPEALKAYLATRGRVAPQALTSIAAYHPTPAGTDLSALAMLGRQVGVSLAMRRFADPATIPVPAIVHLKSQHFSMLAAREPGGAFHVKDVALGGDVVMSEAALRDELTGYALVDVHSRRRVRRWPPKKPSRSSGTALQARRTIPTPVGVADLVAAVEAPGAGGPRPAAGCRWQRSIR